MSELLLTRIISGTLRFHYDNKFYLIKPISSLEKYISQQIFEDTERDALIEGMYSEEEIKNILVENGLWSKDSDDKLESLKKDIEILKVEIFKNYFFSEKKRITRMMLDVAQTALYNLVRVRGQYAHLGASGFAAMMKTRYMVGLGLHTSNNKKVFYGYSFLKKRTKMLEEAIIFYGENEVTERDYRKLARNDFWKAMWGTRNSVNGLFGCSSVDLTNEQIQLINWTAFFDSIHESPECPESEIINDDDALDGWIIMQKKERDEARKQKTADKALGLLPNTKEVFIPVDDKEDISRVESLNSYASKMTKKERHDALNKAGILSEESMPDSQRELATMAMRGGK